MVDLKSLQDEVAQARRARMEAEAAGFNLEHLIEQMRAGRTLQEIDMEEIEMEELASREDA
ncbi:hypothetical protein [Pseudorhodoplanes sinuspersici]|uniref:Uncharacterized protein n=1 Tax=Pseudorhodoplanes sinuspersici TaxID=1235591 RepID=A0A1W6ZQY1_9HYPH|nr:hypothetical protein [Pseudorhodoplanes sinuspersici]ARP99174.1 hypothetical protein CAK95_08810 [Pseudorhodoplanes sinuspersici]RKE69166.1 hypothetical protein DFP91_3593 [Pseudorhodoplanes sinuspersici]